ncbi:hypothetical protein C1645_814081 [Glomus cerebriforme]|uniref:Uncharacterized protein n=1 Tax=Glomus cerebriforme TaxID=658196 RepID=A0A397THJ0_9GLOM|nr:hypothetical protein C1645_814081 [Glomus cerebriforme]
MKQFLNKIEVTLFETLHIFLDAYSLLHENSLKKHDMENKAIYTLAYKKSIMKQEGNTDHSNGIAYITTKKQYEFCITED